MSPRPRKSEQPNTLPERILATAWKQIAETGAPALSLRSIGRELNITAPAIYNYYPDRDALVTALIVDAFGSFGDALEESLAGIARQDFARQLKTLGQAYRQWAVRYPERYQLIFGTPIAGYSAPAEITMPVAARSLAVLVGILTSAQEEGRLKNAQNFETSPAAQAMFAAWQAARGPAAPQALFLALIFSGLVHGLVSQEIGHQLPPFITNPGEVYQLALDLLIQQHIKID